MCQGGRRVTCGLGRTGGRAAGDWGLEKAAINENEQKGSRASGGEDGTRRARVRD